jgi:rhamnosyltransferase subunit B
MARILLGWELGSNRGHSIPLIVLAKALEADGHEIVIAAQQPVQFVDLQNIAAMQAPIWPGLLGAAPDAGTILPINMNDILIGLGLSVPGALTSMIRAWDSILVDAKPDVVIADYAPALCCATRDRIRTISYGTGFCQPPADMEEFPDLLRLTQKAEPEPLLDIINDELAAAGRAKVKAPPAIFAVDETVVACFTEFDPYQRWRQGAYALPHMAPLAALPDARGDELFVYFHRADGDATNLWDGLIATGLKVRVFIAQADRYGHSALRDRGFVVESDPVPWDLIARRSRIVISHGGLGFTSGALAMGLPHVVVPYDLEKIVTALTVRKLGVGDCIVGHNEPDAVATLLLAANENPGLRTKTRSAASVIRDRIDRYAGRSDVTIIRGLVAETEELVMQTNQGVLV